MAFNPFNIFRRNQRVIFAIITVFVMFTFVLSSGLAGKADFFSWFPDWVGSKTNKGTALFEIDGKRYYSQDLEEIRRQRLVANQYMSMAAGMALSNLQGEINSRIGKASEENRQTLQQIQQGFGMVLSGQVPGNQILPFLDGAQRQLQMLRNKEGIAPTDREIARDMETFVIILMQRMQSPQDVYFTNLPAKTNQDMIEFLLWRKKADKSGINFTDAAVKQLVISEFAEKLGVGEVEVRRRVTEGKMSDSKLWEALNDEFRVRLAQSSVLGQEMMRPNGALNPQPTYSTPFDLFTTYRDLFSPTTYDMLAIPVSNYIDEVKETPTQAELDKLFAEGKSVEPNPASDKPGFKEPRKAKIEWISATGTEPFYKTAADEWLKQGDLQARVGGLFTVPVGPVSPAWVVNLLPLVEREFGILPRYRATVAGFESELNQQYLSGRAFSFSVLDTNFLQPRNIVSAIGAIGGGLPIGPAALFGAGAFQLNAIENERQARLKFSLPLIQAGLVPVANLGSELIGAYEAARVLPKVPGPEVYQAELRNDMLKALTHGFLVKDFDTFTKEVRAKTKDIRDPAKKKAAVASYIDDFVRSRGLKQGATTEFRDEFNAGEDPGLAPLKAEASRIPPKGPLPPVFGRSFFYMPFLELPDLMERLQRLRPEDQRAAFEREEPATGLYEPRDFPTRMSDVPPQNPQPNFLFWRTEEKPPQTVTPRVAEPKVLAAWKELKARELAKQEAERIATEVRTKAATSPGQVFQNLRDAEAALQAKFTDPAKKDAIKLFENPGVVPYVTEQDFRNPMSPPQVREWSLEQSSMVPFPNAEMTKKLLAERKQPTGTTFVMSDSPKDTFYVSSVAARFEKTEPEFTRDVYNAMGQSPVRGLVIQTQRKDSMKIQQEGAVDLLKKEFKYQNENTELLEKNNRGE